MLLRQPQPHIWGNRTERVISQVGVLQGVDSPKGTSRIVRSRYLSGIEQDLWSIHLAIYFRIVLGMHPASFGGKVLGRRVKGIFNANAMLKYDGSWIPRRRNRIGVLYTGIGADTCQGLPGPLV